MPWCVHTLEHLHAHSLAEIPQVPGRPGGKNPLHIACEAGQEEAAMLLLGSTACVLPLRVAFGVGFAR